MEPRELAGYILARTGCIHPFRLSRLLALAEMESLRRRGERLTTLRYVPGPGTFYIEGLKEVLEGDCFEKREGDPARGVRGCIAYTCEPPRLPSEVAEILDRVIREYGSLDDTKLNEVVLSDPLFKKLTGEGE